LPLWKVGSCSCRFEYGDNVSFKRLITKGREHGGIASAESLFRLCLEENRREGVLDRLISEVKPDIFTLSPMQTEIAEMLATITTQSVVAITKTVKLKGVTYQFSGSNNARLLTMTIPTAVLTAREKAQLQNRADGELGTGKVQVN